MAKKSVKIAFVVIIVLLVLAIIIMGVMCILYRNKAINCATNTQIYCPQYVCADGSQPFSNVVGQT